MKKQIAIALACVAFASNGLCLTADEIIANVQKKYTGLSSLTASGKVVTDIDASGADLTAVLAAAGKPPADAPAQAAKVAEQLHGTITTEFSLRLARPELYSVEWSQPIAPGQVNQGAAWSAGDGCFVLIGDKKLLQQTNLDLGLATATGISSGVAGTLPAIFFARPGNLLKLLGNLSQLPNEKVGGEDCYIVAGDAAGQKITFWITRSFLVKQKRHTLGGTMNLPKLSDEDLHRGLEASGQKVTPETSKQFKKSMALMQAATSRMKGSFTETYENIQVNQPLKPAAFAHAIPPTVER